MHLSTSVFLFESVYNHYDYIMFPSTHTHAIRLLKINIVFTQLFHMKTLLYYRIWRLKHGWQIFIIKKTSFGKNITPMWKKLVLEPRGYFSRNVNIQIIKIRNVSRSDKKFLILWWYLIVCFLATAGIFPLFKEAPSWSSSCWLWPPIACWHIHEHYF